MWQAGTGEAIDGVLMMDPASLAAILKEIARMRDERVPTDELERARAYASGRLELRLEESRHLAAWLGIQEALHDRVLTLDDALGELAKVTSDDIQALAQRLFRDELMCLAVISKPGSTSGLEKALRLP